MRKQIFHFSLFTFHFFLYLCTKYVEVPYHNSLRNASFGILLGNEICCRGGAVA